MPPFFEGAHYREHLLVVHLVVAFYVRETFGHEGHWVEFSICLELGQDRTGREVGCVALEFEATHVSGEGKNGGGSDGVFEGTERAVFIWSPDPGLSLTGQRMEGAGCLGEVLDEPAVEVDKP